MVIESLLGPQGFVIHKAMNGMEALELMKDKQGQFDLILLDVMMVRYVIFVSWFSFGATGVVANARLCA